MLEKEYRRVLRRQLSQPGWALLIYYGIMNMCVIAASSIHSIIIYSRVLAEQWEVTQESLQDYLSRSILSNGWGYILAIALGIFVLWLWQGSHFLFRTVWQANRPMRFSGFWILFCFLVSGQLLFQICSAFQEWELNLFGLSAMSSLEAATISGDTWSMFLYVGLLGPIAEELLFRGALLRILEPFGNLFAVVITAFLFGLFHGNVVQTPYAFAIGLVLGYTAIEYSIGWAMLLHILNNLFLGDMLPRIGQLLGNSMITDVLTASIILICSLVAVICAVKYRKKILAYIREDRLHPDFLIAFFTSPGTIAVTAVLLLFMAVPLIP